MRGPRFPLRVSLVRQRLETAIPSPVPLPSLRQLIEGLGGEKARWTESADRLGAQYVNLTGDVLVSAGVMAYLGPFTATFRARQLSSWVRHCKAKAIPCSESPTLSGERAIASPGRHEHREDRVGAPGTARTTPLPPPPPLTKIPHTPARYAARAPEEAVNAA